MKQYAVRITVDVDVTLVVHAPDEETAEQWYHLPKEATSVDSIEVNWNKPWDVYEYEPAPGMTLTPYTQQDVRDALEPIVSELRRNTLLREEPSRDTSVTVEFTGDRK